MVVPVKKKEYDVTLPNGMRARVVKRETTAEELDRLYPERAAKYGYAFALTEHEQR